MAFQVRIKILHRYVALLLILLFFFSQNSMVVNSIRTQELDAMLSMVRARGYNLFSNAIATSDLQLDLLTASANASFTFFAPTDSSLFALAMTQSASAYTATLRYHAVPRRLSVSDLHRLPSQVPIPTLLPSQFVSLTRRLRALSVNGVNVVLPGLYFGSHVAVHGLGGILSLHSPIGIPFASPPLPPFRPTGPQIDRVSKENRAFAVPPAAGSTSIGLSSVPPPITPTNSTISTVDLPFNRLFLGPAPERSHFQVGSPEISSVSPSASPEISSHLTPSLHPPQNEDAITPTHTPLITSAGASETAWMMESEDGLSGRTVEAYEPLDWMTFGFTDGNSNHVDIEDSHPRPNVLKQRL